MFTVALYIIFTDPLVLMVIVTTISVWAIIGLKKDGKSAILPMYLLLGDFLLVIALNAAHNLKYTGANASTGSYQAGINNIFVIVRYIVLSGIMLYLIHALNKQLKGKTKPQSLAKKEFSGIGGWLVVGAIRTISSILSFALIFVYAINRSIIEYYLVNSPDFLNKYPYFSSLSRLGSFLDPSYILSTLLVAFGGVIAVVTALKLFKKDAGFKVYVIMLEGTNLLLALLAILYWLTIGKHNAIENWPVIYLFSSLLVALVSVLFMLYYLISDRVKNTFVN